MPQNARVFLVDDEPMLRAGFKAWLEAAGHQVVLEAASLPEALSKVLQLDEQEVTVAILDGNLSRDDNTGNDGKAIAGAIRILYPQVKILGLSVGNYNWADRMFPKGQVYSRDNSNPLGDAVTAL